MNTDKTVPKVHESPPYLRTRLLSVAKDPSILRVYDEAQATLKQYAWVFDYGTEAAAARMNVADDDAWQRLLMALSNEWTSTGCGERSAAFWSAKSPTELEAVYSAMMAAIVSNIEDPRLLETEWAEYAKAGPYYNAPSAALLEGTVRYIAPPDYGVHDATKGLLDDRESLLRIARQVGRELIQAYGGPGEMITPEEAVAVMPKDTYYGAPYYTSQYYDPSREGFGAELEEAMATAVLATFDPGEAIAFLETCPVVTFSRVVPSGRTAPYRSATQVARPGHKARRTFAASKHEAVMAKCVSVPVLTAFKETSFGIFYRGNDDPDARLAIQGAIADADHVLSLDYSEFDQTVRDIARDCVFEALRVFFDGDEGALNILTVDRKSVV